MLWYPDQSDYCILPLREGNTRTVQVGGSSWRFLRRYGRSAVSVCSQSEEPRLRPRRAKTTEVNAEATRVGTASEQPSASPRTHTFCATTI